MNPRTSGILLAVALALGAFVYFYEIRGGEQRKAEEEASKRIFPDVESADVTAIAVTTPEGARARVERREGGWQVLEPVDFPGDATTLDGRGSTLAQLTSEAEIGSPQPLEVYGLAEGGREVRFEAGGRERTLRIGRKTPVGANSYVTAAPADTPRVFTVPTWRVNSLAKPLDELRDRTVLDFDRTAVDRIAASWPGGGVVLERADEGWRLVAPLEGPADASTVDTLLSDLSFLRADGFRDEPLDDAAAGLVPPEFSVELRSKAQEGGDPMLHRFALGSLQDDEQRYARGTHETLYLVPAARLSDFPRTLTAYRFKQIAKFETADVRSFELAFHPVGAEPTTVRAELEEGRWTAAPEKLAAGVATRLVAELASLKGSEIVADSMGPEEMRALGLAPPRVALRVYGAAEEGGEAPLLAEVHLGDGDADRGILARDAGAETVYRIDYALAEQVPISREAFVNRFVSQEPDLPEPAPDDVSIDPSLSDDAAP